MAASAATLGLAQGFVPPMPPPNAVLLGLGLALSLSFLVGNLALQYGAARLAAHTTALVMLSEVIFASVSSVVLGAATLETRTLAGGALILLAAAWSAWPTRARAQASPSTAPETTR
jgi:drug/metabolite transporter (DMT)-like permease